MKAYNDYVVIIRDETETEKDGLVVPSAGREKPAQGTIHSTGSLVEDPDLKNAAGKKCIFHKGVGQEIDVNGETYLILHGREVIGEP